MRLAAGSSSVHPNPKPAVEPSSSHPTSLPSLERHLRAFVGREPTAPLLTGPKGGRLRLHALNAAWRTARANLRRPEIHFHDLRGAGLTWAATQSATTREIMARAGHASPAAALRYQHAAEDRDVVIVDALSGLAESAQRMSTLSSSAGYSRDDHEDPPASHSATTVVACTV